MYVEDASGVAEGTIAEYNFTVPEMLSNYLDGLPSIDTTLVNRPTVSGAMVHLMPLRDGVATAIIHRRSDTITSVESLKSETCVTSSTTIGGVASTITIAAPACSLSRNIAYDVYVYIEDGSSELDGTLSAPMELVLLSNEFSVDPVIRAPITPETVGFVFTPSRDGKMWAMIVDRAAKSGVLGINSQSMMHSLHNAKGGKLCSFGGTLVSTGEVTTLILFDCDASSGLTIGAPYTLFVYVEDLSGGAGTMKSIDFAVPEVVSNYFDGPSSIVRGSLSTSGVSVTTRALLDGHAWIIVEDATVELSTIASLKASLCRSSVPVVAGVHTVLSVSTCTLIRNRAYNVYVYVESSKEMNDGTLSAAMMVEVMSNEFSQTPIVRAPVNPEALSVEFTPLRSGFSWMMIAERSSAYLAYNSSVMKLTDPLSASLRRGGA